MVDFRQPFSEKYRPQRINDFIGLKRPKSILTHFSADPFESAWLFVGPPGLGKTTMAHVLGEAIGAQLHHVPAKSCNLERVEALCEDCHYVPRRDWKPVRFHFCVIDEVDAISHAAQIAFLSILDGTAGPSDTIFTFTGNDQTKLEPRFLSRCRIVEFASEGIDAELEDRLRHIWATETYDQTGAPDFAKIVRDSAGNVRSALHRLEVEMLSASRPGRSEGMTSAADGLLRACRFREPGVIAIKPKDLPTEVHSLAGIIPALPPEPYALLENDIAAHGVKVPIVLYEEKILDGKERVRVCKKLGIDCPVVIYSGREPLSMVLSLNLARRHLNESQRAMVAARIANIGHGGDRRHTDQDAKLRVDQIAVRQAAQRLNVSSRSVEAAKKVLREGGPDLIAAINAGKISVSKAAKAIVRSRTGLSPSRKKLAPPKLHDAKDSARWLWGEIISLEQSGILHRPPADLFSEMTENERAEILRVAPTLVSWLRRFGEWAFRHAQAAGQESGL